MTESADVNGRSHGKIVMGVGALLLTAGVGVGVAFDDTLGARFMMSAVILLIVGSALRTYEAVNTRMSGEPVEQSQEPVGP